MLVWDTRYILEPPSGSDSFPTYNPSDGFSSRNKERNTICCLGQKLSTARGGGLRPKYDQGSI